MGIFVNRRFNLIYVHAALQAFTSYGGEAFAFVYLLKAGIPVPVVLLSIGGLFGSRLLFRMLVLPLAKRMGLRNALILGILLEGSAYPLLSQVTHADAVLIAYLGVWAVSSSIYWTTYHAYVVLIGDGEHRGAQVSAMEFVGTFMGIIAPVTTGLLLTWFAPIVAFSVVGLAMASSAIPLLFLPNLKIAPDAVMPRETRRVARLVMFTDGLRAGAFYFTWLIALFITLGSSFAAYGGALSLAGIAGAAAGLFVGRSIDLGKGRRAAQIGFVLVAAAILARAFGYPYPWSAVLANAMAAVAMPVYGTAFGARVYALAQHSPCPLRFHIIAEGGWDLGTAMACFTSAGLIYLGFSFFWPLMLALGACALGYWVVTGTFEREAGAAATSSNPASAA
jgi:MFS transporter, DHA1 family, inner membrane transport protein